MEQDSILLHAVHNHIYFPPNAVMIASILASQKKDELFAKKHGLNQRTLYRSLLLEFLGENTSYTTINVTTLQQQLLRHRHHQLPNLPRNANI
jgi:hypothetical protein